MAKLSKDLALGTLHPRETLFLSGNLGSLNAELAMPCDGCASVTVDLRGTYNLNVAVEGTIDGINWTAIPVRPLNQASTAYVVTIVPAAPGTWTGSIAGFRSVRARCAAYTSGAATCIVAASIAPVDQSLLGSVTNQIVTTVGAAAAAATLTLAAPGAGLRHYLTSLSINRYVSVGPLTASPAPVTVTSTNLPGALAFTFEADAAATGTIARLREDFAYPLAASAQNVATTLVCPATPGVIWRVTAGYLRRPVAAPACPVA
jgi:hypothetical protein